MKIKKSDINHGDVWWILRSADGTKFNVFIGYVNMRGSVDHVNTFNYYSGISICIEI